MHYVTLLLKTWQLSVLHVHLFLVGPPFLCVSALFKLSMLWTLQMFLPIVRLYFCYQLFIFHYWITILFPVDRHIFISCPDSLQSVTVFHAIFPLTPILIILLTSACFLLEPYIFNTHYYYFQCFKCFIPGFNYALHSCVQHTRM